MNDSPFDSDLAKLAAALPQASSLDLYRLEWAIRRLHSEPKRIIAIRSRLNLGMTVRFFCAQDGAMHLGRVVALRDRDLTIDDSAQHCRWSGVPYAAIDVDAGPDDTVEIFDAARSRTTPRRPGRADFKIGDNVTFIDRDQHLRLGRIVRLNQKTASIECDNGNWRVSYALLQRVVDV